MDNKEDLGIKIGTKDEALWDDVIKRTEADIDNLKKSIKVNEALKEIAEKKLNEEKAKI